MVRMGVGLVYGGRSGEHEVSVRSAESIRKHLDKKKWKVVDIFIGKDGSFDAEAIKKIDVVFPIVHGTYGEDGCLQGLLEMLGKPYVGAGVLGSAVGMDKDVQKRLLRQAGIPVARYISLSSGLGLRSIQIPFEFPVFVKPANGGSSVGVSKVNSKKGLKAAVRNAFLYDTKVLVEEAVEGREIEVAVLDGKASIPGEIVPRGHEFYDYQAKYIDENGAELIIPAKISKKQSNKIQMTAEKVFGVLECEGMARVDMFLSANGRITVNEINTLPGFTSISMYPKLWEVSGLPYEKLLDRLLESAMRRWKKKLKVKREYNPGGGS